MIAWTVRSVEYLICNSRQNKNVSACKLTKGHYLSCDNWSGWQQTRGKYRILGASSHRPEGRQNGGKDGSQTAESEPKMLICGLGARLLVRGGKSVLP